MAVQAKWDFIGRERELAELEAVLRLPGVGQGELVLIGGEAGIGKTRLAEMAAESARRAGLQVAWAGCPEDRAVPAFWPWTQLLHAIVPDRTESTNAPAAEPLARLLRTPGIEPDAKENDPELARLQLFEAVAGQVRATAENRPLLLVLDDLHWADPSSIRLLAFVATMLRAIPAIVVGTYRDTEADPDSSFGEALPQLLRLGRKLSLAGLTAPEVGQLVTQLTGAQPSSETTVAIHQHTAGNPFFTRELVRLLETQEVLDRLGNGSIPQVGLPEGVRAVLRRRLARLSDQCRAVLAFGAALGQEFALDPVQRVTGLASLPLLEYLDEAMAARLVHEVGVGRYAFSHAFTREAVYRELGLARRVRLHEQVGEALEALRGRGLAVEPVELAHHFRLAAPAGSAAKAVHYAVEAGDRAMAMLAHEDAVRLYESALAGLDLAPSAVDRAELLLALADARVAAGDLPGARQTYQQAAAEARTSGSPSQLARAALGMGSGPTGFEVALLDRSQLDLLEEALAALGDRPSALRAWVLARLSVALSYTDSVERRIVLSEAAVEVARRTGDTAALAYALSAHCDCIAGPAGCEQRLDETAEIVSLARTLGDRRMEMLGRRMRLVALLEVGDIAGADAEVEAYAHLAESVRQPLFQWYVPLWRGLRALMSGRLDEAERFAAEAASIGQRASSENAAVLSGGLQWFVLRERGDYRQAEELLGTAFDYMADLGIQAWVTVALARAEAGRLAEARALLDRGVAGEVAAAPLDSEWLPVIAQLTEAAAVLNGHPLAGQLYELLAPHRSRFTVEGIGCAYHGSVERHLGVLAALLDRRQSAAGHFEAALAANRRLGAPLLVAHTLRDWGRWLGERERLAEALAIYRELGLEFWARFMENLLGPGPVAEAGATPEGNVFRKEGDFWTVGFANRVARLKDAKGLRDLARLLAQPGREMHALDLADGRGSRRGLDRASAAAQGLRAAGDSWEVIDAEAREAYKTRLGELDADLEEADRAGDIERSARGREERDALVAQLAAAYGLGGRARRSGDAAERARSAVTWRIRDALVRIEAAHPELGHHLRHSVRTGTFCVYDPEEPADWCL